LRENLSGDGEQARVLSGQIEFHEHERFGSPLSLVIKVNSQNVSPASLGIPDLEVDTSLSIFLGPMISGGIFDQSLSNVADIVEVGFR